MAARVYSHRFVYTEEPGIWKQYRVPEGMRAVVRDVTYASIVASGAVIYVKVHGLYVATIGVPAAFTSASRPMRVVAYGGELIELAIDGSDAAALVSGYLFDDPFHESYPPSGPVSKPSPPLEDDLLLPG